MQISGTKISGKRCSQKKICYRKRLFYLVNFQVLLRENQDSKGGVQKKKILKKKFDKTPKILTSCSKFSAESEFY